MSNFEFIDNTAGFSGGGMITFGTATVTEGRIERNRCTQVNLDCFGGGLRAQGALILTSTKLIANSAVYGGGLHHGGSDPALIVNVLFARNTASQGASLSLASRGRDTILHSSIVDTILNPGQAIAIFSSTVSITNTLIANHTIGISQTGGTVFEDYNLYFNISTPKTGFVTSGGHSLIGDPKFIDPANDDYRPGEGSAAIGHGVDVGITTDLEGNARPQGNGFDIGAYETAGGDLYLPLIFRDTP